MIATFEIVIKQKKKGRSIPSACNAPAAQASLAAESCLTELAKKLNVEQTQNPALRSATNRTGASSSVVVV